MICGMIFLHIRGFLGAFALLCTAASIWPENPGANSPAMANSVEIVEQMQRHNQSQAKGLAGYKALRHYQVEYKGFSATIAAKMDVEVNYDAASGKSFRIVSQSGSNLLCNKVLKRAVDSEKEASQDKGGNALTTANYRFQLAGSENLNGRTAYILDVEPLTASKFLYRGRIWVDAADFAVVKMETEPAKNPSFWISRTLIHYTSAPVNGFWLPREVRSETKVRIGGTAVLTIDYGSYQVEPNDRDQGSGVRVQGSVKEQESAAVDSTLSAGEAVLVRVASCVTVAIRRP